MRAFKRALDLLIAGLGTIVSAPVIALLAVAVRLESAGHPIYTQTRIGLDGEPFTIYKLRTMVSGAEFTGAGLAINQGDDRITRVGAFLRRTSLDELPQFFNVLQGTMSIVGPRPHAVTHNKEYRQIIKAYMVRHKVKPGITGWAQVNGQRGETDTVEKMRTRVEYDLEYLRNWSLALDLKIIAATVRVLFFDRHAY
jgi:putative colanic acid biosysnthesis UDP-glucose lipid carrier transferase